MDKNIILEKLTSILKQIKPSIDTAGITDDTQLVRDLGLDSLTILLLSLAIEKDFGFQFKGAPQFSTVGEVIDFIGKNV